jgi:hypothetical protein
MRNAYKCLVRKPQGRRFGDQGTNEMIILKLILKKWDVRVWTQFISLRIKPRHMLLSVMKLWVLYERKNVVTAELSDFQE